MKKVVAIVALGALLVTMAPVTAHAHGAALGLAAFAAFTSLLAFPFVAAAAVAPYTYPYAYGYGYGNAYPYAYPAATYSTGPAYYSAPSSYAPSASYAPPQAPAIQREVVYPHGRHVLYGDGIRTAYQWVWIPTPPPAPGGMPAVPPPPAGTPPPPPVR